MEFSTSRRGFLGATLAGLAAGGLASSRLLRADEAIEKAKIEPTAKLLADPAFRLSTLFLTWQRDPTTTMTVQWIGAKDDTDATLFYAADKAAAWATLPAKVKPFGKTDFNVYRYEMTGLKPGSDYQFRIGKQPKIYRFRTMPAKATDTFSFISGGDCGVNKHAVANNIQAAKQDPQFAIIGGDLAYENGKTTETILAFWRNYSQTMIAKNERLIPLVPCIGNHEVDGGYEKTRDKAPFYYALFDGLFPETGFAKLDFGDYLSLVLLDTNHTTPIGGAQTDWLEKTLKERVDHPHVFAVNHVPSYPSYRNSGDTTDKDGKETKAGTGAASRKFWVPLFDKYRVPVVLEHHDHTFKRTKPMLDGMPNDNGVLYLGDGSWGRLCAPNAAEKISYLAISSQTYHLSLHKLEGKERIHTAIDEDGKEVDVTRSGQRKKGAVVVPVKMG